MRNKGSSSTSNSTHTSRHGSSSNSSSSIPNKLFNHLKTTKIGIAFEIMIPLIMVYFVLGALLGDWQDQWIARNKDKE